MQLNNEKNPGDPSRLLNRNDCMRLGTQHKSIMTLQNLGPEEGALFIGTWACLCTGLWKTSIGKPRANFQFVIRPNIKQTNSPKLFMLRTIG